MSNSVSSRAKKRRRANIRRETQRRARNPQTPSPKTSRTGWRTRRGNGPHVCSKRGGINNRPNTEDRERCMRSTRRFPKVGPNNTRRPPKDCTRDFAVWGAADALWVTPREIQTTTPRRAADHPPPTRLQDKGRRRWPQRPPLGKQRHQKPACGLQPRQRHRRPKVPPRRCGRCAKATRLRSPTPPRSRKRQEEPRHRQGCQGPDRVRTQFSRVGRAWGKQETRLL